DMTAQVERRGDAFAFGTALIDTPLPVGYPAPTPPGAIELKRYPVVRRAQVSGTVSPDMASNLAFFPLFNHIKRRDIAMTSPVEMDYSNLRTRIDQEERPIGPSAWNMAFLYRTTDQGPTGEDERNSNVVVLDAEPVTVVSMGMQGGYALARTTDAVLQLEQWLAANPQWEAVNEDARAFFYNGPDRRNKDKWAEAQLAVRFVGDKKK
ncbi:MAG: heme-binding protein, partial [Phycisphaerales bacterium]|nr:heme-binding protein [Phycisphaerales bacterium]